MSDDSIKQKVREILSEQLGLDVDRIEDHSTLTEDLGADSMDLIEIVMVAEEEFDLEFPDGDTEKWRTVGDIVRYIEEKKR